jgi:hypothetical protein
MPTHYLVVRVLSAVERARPRADSSDSRQLPQATGCEEKQGRRSSRSLLLRIKDPTEGNRGTVITSHLSSALHTTPRVSCSAQRARAELIGELEYDDALPSAVAALLVKVRQHSGFCALLTRHSSMMQQGYAEQPPFPSIFVGGSSDLRISAMTRSITEAG